MRALTILGEIAVICERCFTKSRTAPCAQGLERHQRRESTVCEGGCLCNPLPGKSTGSSLCKPFHSCDGVGEEVTLTLVFFL